jgi:hypothetical protein
LLHWSRLAWEECVWPDRGRIRDIIFVGLAGLAGRSLTGDIEGMRVENLSL